MTLRADIQTQLRTVTTITSGLGETWQYRKLTSAPGVDTRTYGTATDIAGHQSARSHSEAFQDDRGVWMKQERCSFRVSDATTELAQGDQLVDTASVYWAVASLGSCGVGTRRYELVRDVPFFAEGSSRKGGV